MGSYKCATQQLWRRKQSDFATVLPKISRAFQTQKTKSDQLLGMVQSGVARQPNAHSSHSIRNIIGGADGISALSGRKFTRKLSNPQWNPLPLTRNYGTNHKVVPYFSRAAKKDMSTVEEPYDDDDDYITYDIPQKPLTFVAGASYGVVVLLGLGIAGTAAYLVSKELIFEENEYTVFNKALKRIQDDAKVRAKVGYPITGYGEESRNRAARQHMPNRIWTDEDGLKHVSVNFCVRGPQGAGDVYAKMFKDTDEKWKYKHLVVETRAPSQSRLILESEGILDYISLYFGHAVPAS